MKLLGDGWQSVYASRAITRPTAIRMNASELPLTGFARRDLNCMRRIGGLNQEAFGRDGALRRPRPRSAAGRNTSELANQNRHCAAERRAGSAARCPYQCAPAGRVQTTLSVYDPLIIWAALPQSLKSMGNPKAGAI